jgi:FtsZ-binding cell division protein ZapB
MSLANLALLEEKMGNAKDALHLFSMAEDAFLELGSPLAAQVQKDRERLERKQAKSREIDLPPFPAANEL